MTIANTNKFGWCSQEQRTRELQEELEEQRHYEEDELEEREEFSDTEIINSEVKNNPKNTDNKESPKIEQIAIK
jgi:hypothetical protein